ncbi:serpin-ZX [Tanacetum coccineum]
MKISAKEVKTTLITPNRSSGHPLPPNQSAPGTGMNNAASSSEIDNSTTQKQSCKQQKIFVVENKRSIHLSAAIHSSKGLSPNPRIMGKPNSAVPCHSLEHQKRIIQNQIEVLQDQLQLIQKPATEKISVAESSTSTSSWEIAKGRPFHHHLSESRGLCLKAYSASSFATNIAGVSSSSYNYNFRRNMYILFNSLQVQLSDMWNKRHEECEADFDLMDKEGFSKRTVSGDEPCIQSEKKHKKVTLAATISANTTTVVTKTLLDDARNGFEKGNFVCSPLSLDIILGMLAVGAEGETLKQMLGFLRHESMDQFLSQSPSSKLLAQSFNSGLELFTLMNGVWVQKRASPLLSSYQKVLKTVYNTEATYVDFKDKVKLKEAVEEINSWVKKETKELIPEIIKTADFKEGDDVLMVLVNALYFKGTWHKQFEAHMTRSYDFYLLNGEKVSVPFMTLDELRVKYGSFNGYRMIKLPYKSNDRSKYTFSMYIFLPDRIDGLQDLIEVFHADDTLFHGDFDLKMETLWRLWIPKFKISSSFEPEDVMKIMGLTLPFEKSNSEFTGIVERGPDDDPIYVSKILQKSVIEVDERGTEAASCSMMMVSEGCIPTKSFVADHPFMFMIREDTSKAVLFVGAVLNPSS